MAIALIGVAVFRHAGLLRTELLAPEKATASLRAICTAPPESGACNSYPFRLLPHVYPSDRLAIEYVPKDVFSDLDKYRKWFSEKVKVIPDARVVIVWDAHGGVGKDPDTGSAAYMVRWGTELPTEAPPDAVVRRGLHFVRIMDEVLKNYEKSGVFLLQTCAAAAILEEDPKLFSGRKAGDAGFTATMAVCGAKAETLPGFLPEKLRLGAMGCPALDVTEKDGLLTIGELYNWIQKDFREAEKAGFSPLNAGMQLAGDPKSLLYPCPPPDITWLDVDPFPRGQVEGNGTPPIKCVTPASSAGEKPWDCWGSFGPGGGETLEAKDREDTVKGIIIKQDFRS